MIEFYEQNNFILFAYEPDHNGENWMVKELEEDKTIYYKKTFRFNSRLLHKLPATERPPEEVFDDNPIEFKFGKIVGDYINIYKGILTDKFDIYIGLEVPLKLSLFVAGSDLSIFGTIDDLIKEDMYIGGPNEDAMPLDAFNELLKKFPTSYERSLYAKSRITTILRQHFESAVDSQAKYEKYMNKRISLKGKNLEQNFKGYEIDKFQAILDKMEKMLRNESAYNEKQWQEEILQILLLLYPKYIFAFREVPLTVKGVKYLDYMLVDSSGHVDVIEIKRPHGNSIITQEKFRNNYIPLRELSGTIMQIEKYIFHLNRWAEKGEKILTEKYADNLPHGFTIKITNPIGIIIMGRDNQLSDEQKSDFEVVKRKYKNVIDTITYDDLIRRLKFTIQQIKKR